MSDFVADNLAILRNRNSTEADVKSKIIYRALTDILDFAPEKIFEESSSNSVRPDYCCGEAGAYAEFIVEAKALDINIYRQRSPDEPINKHPLGQLAHYLTHHELCGHSTIGLLSNGVDWAVMVNNNNKVIRVDQFSAESRDSLSKNLQATLEIAKRIVSHTKSKNKPDSSNWLAVLRRLAENNQLQDPRRILTDLILEKPKTNGRLFPLNPAEYQLLNGLPQNIAAIPVDEFEYETSTLFGKQNRNVYLMCLRPDTYDGQISADDITNCLHHRKVRRFIDQNDRCYGIAYSNIDPENVQLRGFVWTGDVLQVTEFFALNLPKAINVKRLKDIAEYRYTEARVSIPSMSLETLQKQFHEDIDAWFNRTNQSDKELRHLIRVLFIWLLKDRGLVPEDAFPLHLPENSKPTSIHSQLDWLFTQVLAKPKCERTVQNNILDSCSLDDAAANAMIRDMPFLNGSIFHELDDKDLPQTLGNDLYLSQNPDTPGLFDILARYQWTLSETSGYSNEIAIDPNMLGQMFERLVLRTEGIRYERGGLNKKMPDGTYFTPSDVVDEMVADAIAHWLHNRMPTMELSILRQLTHPMPQTTVWEDWKSDLRTAISNHLASITILDPCCGSGAFTVSAMQALIRAELRLNNQSNSLKVLNRIIEKQLYAVDIKPLAVSIAKLRLFIALVDAQLKQSPTVQLNPLPNLEVRLIVANTLRMDMSTTRDMFGINDNPEWEQNIAELNANRELWTQGAYDSQDKSEIRIEEERIRNKLKKIAENYHDADTSWLDLNLLQEPKEALELDIRNCFVRNNWDIVIGNPPYQKVNTKERQSYGQGYITESCNLYTLFMEVALKVVAEQGTITLIVPHSIVFRQQIKYQILRNTIEEHANSVYYRTYDNRPESLFPRLPWLGPTNENRQRVTILTINRDSNKPCIGLFSNGVLRLRGGQREKVLKTYWEPIRQLKIHQQWSHAPTIEFVNLLREMAGDRTTNNGKTIYFPETAYYYVAAIPDSVDYKLRLRNKSMTIRADDEYWAWIGLYNSRVFFAYWRMVGDLFHVTQLAYTTVRRPKGWDKVEIRDRTAQLAKELWSKSVMDRCQQRNVNNGREWLNWDFFSDPSGERIINEIDRLIVTAYELPYEPLAQQFEILRLKSAYELANVKDSAHRTC